MFKLTSTPLENINLKENFTSEQAGAFASFEGWVRDHNDGKSVESLEYEAHAKLCGTEAQKILNLAAKKFNIIDARCFHRVGRLRIGEMAVWVGVVASRRDDAFKACRFIIDDIKHRLPIWKKEFYTDGDSGWVNCEECSRIDSSEDKYYSRQTALSQIGREGQKKLTSAKVLVVGAGGLGSSALASLAGSGVGTIGICEHDQLEESNLPRQTIYSHQDVGRSKIDLAKQYANQLNPYIQVKTHHEKLTSSNVEFIIKDYDVILDCADNFSTKFLLNDAAVIYKKVLVQSSVYQYEGQLAVMIPGQSGGLRSLWTDIPENGCVGSCSEAGVLGAVPALFGHMQALEAIKYIVGMESIGNDVIILNFLNYSLRRIKLPKAFCSDILQIDPEKYESDQPFSIDLTQFTNDQLNQFVFVDIRNDEECRIDPITNVRALPIPMSQLETTPSLIDKHKRYILVCAKGARSQKLTQTLRALGMSNVFSLAGGVQSVKNLETSLERI